MITFISKFVNPTWMKINHFKRRDERMNRGTEGEKDGGEMKETCDGSTTVAMMLRQNGDRGNKC